MRKPERVVLFVVRHGDLEEEVYGTLDEARRMVEVMLDDSTGSPHHIEIDGFRIEIA